MDGQSGYSGRNGVDGIDGTRGYSGASGWSGQNGSAGGAAIFYSSNDLVLWGTSGQYLYSTISGNQSFYFLE